MSYAHVLDRVATALDHVPLHTPTPTRAIHSVLLMARNTLFSEKCCWLMALCLPGHLEKSQTFEDGPFNHLNIIREVLDTHVGSLQFDGEEAIEHRPCK